MRRVRRMRGEPSSPDRRDAPRCRGIATSHPNASDGRPGTRARRRIPRWSRRPPCRRRIRRPRPRAPAHRGRSRTHPSARPLPVSHCHQSGYQPWRRRARRRHAVRPAIPCVTTGPMRNIRLPRYTSTVIRARVAPSTPRAARTRGFRPVMPHMANREPAHLALQGEPFWQPRFV